MLVLSRKKNESVIIDGHIRVTIVDTGNNTVRIGIEAPRDVEILRSELKTVKPAAVPAPVEDVACFTPEVALVAVGASACLDEQFAEALEFAI